MNKQDAESDIGSFQLPIGEADMTVAHALQEEGRSWREIHADLLSRKRGDYNWRAGRTPLYVYHDNDELLAVSRDAYNLYFSENALGGRAFPSLVSMEREVIQMCLSLFQAPPEADGSFTSGGTESIFLAVKSARDQWRQEGTGRPNIVIPRTAHPAFDKAAHYLDVDVIRIGCRADLRVDVHALASAVNGNTALIAGSAPCYPYGVFDPIPELAEIALAQRKWLHVDACLGGFLAPFAKDEGYDIPPFDFSVPGVRSLSADLHKYGFSAKGASVLLHRYAEQKTFQGFLFANWPRGTYATETFLGSRPGGSIASAWAVSRYLGRAGYRRLAAKTMEAKQRLIRGIERIRGLRVIRPTELTIVLYESIDPGVNIDAVGDALGERGWFVARSREPRAIHFTLNAVHAPVVSEYLRDLAGAVEHVRRTGKVAEHDDMTY